MAKRKSKRARVEMIDRRGNIARPWPEDVPAWEAKGWAVAGRTKANVADQAQEGDDQ